jgi:hypothetical protein
MTAFYSDAWRAKRGVFAPPAGLPSSPDTPAAKFRETNVYKRTPGGNSNAQLTTYAVVTMCKKDSL